MGVKAIPSTASSVKKYLTEWISSSKQNNFFFDFVQIGAEDRMVYNGINYRNLSQFGRDVKRKWNMLLLIYFN